MKELQTPSLISGDKYIHTLPNKLDGGYIINNTEDEFISITKSFFTKENALAAVKSYDEEYLTDWENVETHIRYTKDNSKFYTHSFGENPRGVYRVELIYRKRQLELKV